MTLIAALHKNGEPSFLLSDVALSFGGPPLDNTGLPLQQKIENGYFELPEISNETVSGSCQKMLFWGHHAIQWAGSYVVALSILIFLKTKLATLTHETFLPLLNDEFGDDLKEVCLIYHFVVEGTTHLVQLNCEEHFVGDTRVICAGTGSYRFWDEFEAQGLDVNLSTNFQHLTARLMHLLVQEMNDPNAYFYGIGITYEVGVLSQEGFVKKPYTTCIFSHSEDSFGLRLISSNNYVGDELFVTLTLAKNKPNWHKVNWVYLPNKFLLDVNRIFYVFNPLNRGVNPTPIFEELLTEKVHVGARSLFSITIMEKHQIQEEISVGTNFESLAHIPAAIVHFVCAGGFGVASRALLRREVEEIYLGKSFTPPANQEEFYKRQEEIRVKAVSFDFENIIKSAKSNA